MKFSQILNEGRCMINIFLKIVMIPERKRIFDKNLSIFPSFTL